MLRFAGAFIAIAGLIAVGAWSLTSGSEAKSLAQDMEIPFAGLFAMMGGLFAWMLGMARREAEGDLEWARVDRLVADAREELLASGYLSPPPVPASHSRVVDRMRVRPPQAARPTVKRQREHKPQRPSRPRTPAPEPVSASPPAPVERPRPRPRTAAARAAAART